MRRVALSFMMVGSALPLTLPARAACDTAPCVHAEPMWLSPAARRFAVISDTQAPALGQVAGTLQFGFRLRPGVISAPAPNQAGRDVNVLSHATDVTLGLSAGIGRELEVTLVLPAGLYQRGAGIKGITHQAAPVIAEQSLHDPRLGFGFALPVDSRVLSAKLRLELKLPLGGAAALAGERSVATSPSLALGARSGGWFAGLELGARWRTPTELFGSRIGSQALVALGTGYELAKPHLTFAAEAYALPSLVRSSTASYVPAEWLASVQYAPHTLPQLSLGVGGGTGLPFSSAGAGSFLGFGVPLFRALAFARWAPSAR